MAYLDVSAGNEEILATGSKNDTRRIISLCVLLVVSFIGVYSAATIGATDIANLNPLAAIFPVAAKRSSYLQTPRVVFFVGKYFGTGMGVSYPARWLLTSCRRHTRNSVYPSSKGCIPKYVQGARRRTMGEI